MLSKIKRQFQKQQFNPGILGIFINPHYFMRKAIFKNIEETAGNLSGNLLDVGCGVKPYQDLFINIKSYTGMEFDSSEQRGKSKADFFYDGKRFPFEDGDFDSVIFTEVLEHIFNPDEFLEEVRRVVKNNGIILLTTPFVWYEHSQPYDYGRYSSFGLKYILEQHGFTIIETRKLCTGIASVFQLFTGYLYTIINNLSNYNIKLALYIVIISPITLLGLLFSVILPPNKDIYLDNLVLARKVK